MMSSIDSVHGMRIATQSPVQKKDKAISQRDPNSSPLKKKKKKGGTIASFQYDRNRRFSGEIDHIMLPIISQNPFVKKPSLSFINKHVSSVNPQSVCAQTYSIGV